jgi:hypothetical protein
MKQKWKGQNKMDKISTIGSVLNTAVSGSATVTFGDKPDSEPCVVYSIVSTVPRKSIKGTLGEKNRIQVDVWSSDFTMNNILTNKVKFALNDNCKDFMLGTLVDYACYMENDVNLWRSMIQFIIWD